MSAPQEKVTFCRICEPLCGMVATVEDGKLVKLRPDPDNPLSQGYACPKGIAMAEVQNDPDRVTHPLRRNSAGEFERVSWDDALDDIGARLGRVLDERGPGAVGLVPRQPGRLQLLARCSGARASSTASARHTPTAPAPRT